MKVLCLLLNNTLTIQGQRGINCENERIIGGVKTITKNLKKYFKTLLLALISFIKNNFLDMFFYSIYRNMTYISKLYLTILRILMRGYLA